MRTLDATTGQVVTACCVAQVPAAVPRLALGVPAGLVLYWSVSIGIDGPAADVVAGHRRPAHLGAHPQLSGQLLKADAA